MAKTLRNLVPGKVRVTHVRMTGVKSAEVDYEELNENDEVENDGTAACFDVDAIQLDDDNMLIGDARLSQTGEFIQPKRTFDRTGLGRKRK